MLDFNLEYYRTFYYVATLGSITKTAEALFLSQPAVTRSIQKLEEQFKCLLFRRVSKGMKLTKEGCVLLEYVSEAFHQLMEGEKKIKQMTSFEAGQLEIAATETAIYHFLLPKIKIFRDAYPQVDVHVTGSSTRETIEMVLNNSVDLAIAVTPVPENDNISIYEGFLFQDIFLGGPHYAHLKGKKIPLTELLEYPIVTVEKGTSARENIDRWFAEQGILFEPDFSVRTSTMILPFVESNMAIGVIPSLFANNSVEKAGCFEIMTDQMIPARRLAIISRKDEDMSALGKKFSQVLLKNENIDETNSPAVIGS